MSIVKWFLIATVALSVLLGIGMALVGSPAPTAPAAPASPVIDHRTGSLGTDPMTALVIGGTTYHLVTVTFTNPTTTEWINPQVAVALHGLTLTDGTTHARCTGWRRDLDTLITDPWDPGAALVIPAGATVTARILCTAPSGTPVAPPAISVAP